MRVVCSKEEVDIWMCEDVNDIGNGTPLYGSWELEDWTLVNIRYEIHLLVRPSSKRNGNWDPGAYSVTVVSWSLWWKSARGYSAKRFMGYRRFP